MNLRVVKLTLSFLAALLISSVCGTQYLFSAYSTMLAERLDYSSVQINTIGSAANYGVYLGKLLFGYIADNYQGRRPISASFALFAGYFCLAMTYEGNFSYSSFLLCALYVFIAGMASSAGLVYSLVTIAKNVTSFRGIAFGAPIALSGLSAAIYSETNIWLFKDNTYQFLLFIAISSGLCMFIGSWFLVVVPPPNHQDTVVVSYERGAPSSSSSSSSITNTNLELGLPAEQGDKSENTPLLPKKVKEEIDIGGWDLIYNRDAQILAMAMFFLSGTGLMYINNVGTIIKSLYFSSSNHHNYTSDLSEIPPSQVQELQNMHVFYLSVSSCLGRLIVGLISDLAMLTFKLPRLWFFIISGCWLFLAQLLILFYVDELNKLLIVTILIGFGFGNLYSVTPAIVSEWFGTKRFGLNWGMIACVPGFGGQLFNLLFGYNNDKHTMNNHSCSGANCYNSVFYFSAFTCFFSICSSLFLLYIKYKKS